MPKILIDTDELDAVFCRLVSDHENRAPHAGTINVGRAVDCFRDAISRFRVESDEDLRERIRNAAITIVEAYPRACTVHGANLDRIAALVGLTRKGT